MSLQFVFGSAGSGKTWYVLGELIRLSVEEASLGEGAKYIALVPEQFTMQTQREIVGRHPRHGTMNLDIVSFERLAYRIFNEQGVEGLTILDDMGKNMMLRKLADQNAGELPFFGRNLKRQGFIGKLKSILSEFYQYGVGVEQMEQLLEDTKKNPLLNRKLKDLLVIKKAFGEALGEDRITKEELLTTLCGYIKKSALIEGSTIVLDGFTGFTPSQYLVLEQLLLYAKKVIVTVTLPRDVSPYQKGSEEELFALSKRTVRRLVRLAQDNRVEREEDLFSQDEIPPRFASAPDLAFLEKNILRYRSETWKKKPDSLSICSMKDPAEEVRATAARIWKLVREEGYHFRDIAVVTGNLEEYLPFFERYFSMYDLPYFLDYKKNLLHNPLVELIRSAVEVIRRDYSYESMFRYLKCGMCRMKPEDVDVLENYVLAMGIRGHKKYGEIWERQPYKGYPVDLERLNELRAASVKELEDLRLTFKDKNLNVRKDMEALVNFLIQSGAEQRMEAWKDEFARKGLLNLSKEYEQAYEMVLGLFDQMVELLGEEYLSLEELSDILDSGFEEMKVGLIPSCLDRLVVGDMERTRLDAVSVLFFVGVNEGAVPKNREDGGIFSEYDREVLLAHSVELSPTKRQQSFIDRFYLYLTLTRPSQKLYISFTRNSRDGKNTNPSYIIDEILHLFPRLSIEKQTEGVDEITSSETALPYLAQGLRRYAAGEKSPYFEELYQLLGKEKEDSIVSGLVRFAFYRYQEQGIGRAAARAVYGDTLMGSVTRLEQYAGCAYAQFLSYGLLLRERQEYEFARADMGTVFHRSIEMVFEELKKNGLSIVSLTEDKRKEIVKQCVDQTAADYGNTILSSSARNAYLAGRMERITDRTVWAIGEQLKEDRFVPSGFEVSFSQNDLQGRIDRVDICETEDKVYVRVVDYKSGNTRFDLAEVYYGLQLQLVIYLDAVTELIEKRYPKKEVLPGALMYYHIKDPIVAEEEGKDPKEQILEELSMNGLVSADCCDEEELPKSMEAIPPLYMREVRRYVKRRAAVLEEEILDGRITVEPYKKEERTACDFCPYNAVCGFDLKVPGFKYRRLAKRKPQEIWERMKQENEEEEDG